MLSRIRIFLTGRDRHGRSVLAGIDKALATLVTLAPETLAVAHTPAREATLV